MTTTSKSYTNNHTHNVCGSEFNVVHLSSQLSSFKLDKKVAFEKLIEFHSLLFFACLLSIVGREDEDEGGEGTKISCCCTHSSRSLPAIVEEPLPPEMKSIYMKNVDLIGSITKGAINQQSNDSIIIIIITTNECYG